MWKWGKLELGWGFAALIVLALLGGAGPALPPVLLAAACHELGHLSALRLAGARVERLRLKGYLAGLLTEEILKRVKIVDLSADYRIKDVAVYEKWYGIEHKSPQFIPEAVYGLCELNRKDRKSVV